MKVRSLVLLCSIVSAGVAGLRSAAAESEWVRRGADGRLAYKTTSRGDRIMDFSHAGYMGGGVALPDVAAVETVKPSGGDDTDAIQAAIDRVAALALKDHFRGAVVLAPGVYSCSRTLVIAASGIVLRGSGSGEGGTIVQMTGPRHVAVSIGQRRNGRAARPVSDDDDTPDAEHAAGNNDPVVQTLVSESYVPSGANQLTVADVTGFSVGDLIEIRRPVTPAWVESLGMHDLKRDGRKQTWLADTRVGVTERKVRGIEGRTLVLDIPLADSYEARLLTPPGTIVARVAHQGGVRHIGLEHLRFKCPPLETSYGQAPYSGAHITADDAWIRDVWFEETMNTVVLRGRRATVQGVTVTHTFPNLGASKPADFSIEGTQILIDRCSVTGDNTYWVWTASLHPGPNVVLNSTFRGRGSRIQPHMRWSTGLLIDNCTAPDGGIDFMNRGVAGSGHGWTIGWAVAWNSIASTYIIQNPPGVKNWAIGCVGERVQIARMFDSRPILPEGEFDSHGTPVNPQSLYLAQLEERCGPAAVRAIGYTANVPADFTNKAVPRMPAIAIDRDPLLGVDLARNRPVNTSNIRQSAKHREFGGERAVDGNPDTYWAANDGVSRVVFEVDMEGPVEVSAVAIDEVSALGPRIRDFRIEGQVDSDWVRLAEGSAMDGRGVFQFPKATVWKIRLTMSGHTAYPAIRRFGAYLPEASAAAR